MAYKQEKIKPYNVEEDKTTQVERMFDNIAPKYDFLNHSLSFGIDRIWRKAAINSLRAYKPKRILDVATGTGDFLLLSAKELKPQYIVGIDLSDGMLAVGREKVRNANLPIVCDMRKEDATEMSFESNSFDAVTVAYGVRNFSSLDKGLLEMKRVLKPGGHLAIIELTTPQRFPAKQLFSFYSKVLMPLWGKIISKDKAAYTYLPATMEAFPQGEEMKLILERNGYRDVSFKRFTFGLSTLYIACK